ncbi:activity-dependent neuroprotective protein a [Entelurus aequoreus]|uniref:activity-dependent neuroprotective protein a n=1 Tax=Entelurus aequoreus TaxID=161455 RepID=UPI002B1D09C1|nr:activity-dependent neuroprotective protein a [Entelurus aequoreus]
MYQNPVNDLTTLRKARTKVKVALEDIGLEYCKEIIKDFKDFSPDDETFNETECTDVCVWNPAHSKPQDYRSRPFCCGVCRFSSGNYESYQNHFRNAHKRTVRNRLLLNCSSCAFVANKTTLEIHVRIFHRDILFAQQLKRSDVVRQMQARKPLASGARPMYYCKKCLYRDTLYNGVKRHIYRDHFKHVATPYLGTVSKASVQNGAPFNGDNILCKRCRFTTKSYESLVQHVIEYHERIGAQVTAMIGHSNVLVSSLPSMSQKSSMMVNGGSSLGVNAKAQQVIGYLKPAAPVYKGQSLGVAKKAMFNPPMSTPAAESNGPGFNTAQTQKWKICTVCNELFPENLYSAHFESAHKARIVWALAKYIMKIHNFTSKCLLCNRYLPSDTLLNHMLIHGITCPQCLSAFHSVEKLLEHERRVHPEGYVGPPGASPLTFDLAIKENIQLHVLTFNMKESDSSDQPLAPLNMITPLGKAAPSTFSEINTQTLDNFYCTVMDANQPDRSMCPLCCATLKDPVPNALAIHLRHRHQVLQTMHPVEKRLSYKCVHCLGVYTSNMVASTITLHLVQCRGVGRNLATQGPKSALPLQMSGVGNIKRQTPTHLTANPKKIKLSKLSKAGQVDLALDPKTNEHKTYEARKNFLKAYFNQKPYISPKEEKKLSASLWIWKADICKHFETMQNACKKQCETSDVSVLLGFDMQALKKLKHDMVFENTPRDGSAEGKSGGLKSGTPNMTQTDQLETQNCTKRLPQRISSTRPSPCTEPILIDSDSEPEIEPIPVADKNGDSSLQKIESQQVARSTDNSEHVNTIDGEPGKELLPADNTDNNSPVDNTDNNSPVDNTDNNSPVDNTDNNSALQKIEPLYPAESNEKSEHVDKDDSESEVEPILIANTSGDSDLQKIETLHPAESTEESEQVDKDDSESEVEPIFIANTSGDSDLQKIEPLHPAESTEESEQVDKDDSESEIERMLFANTSGGTDLQKIDSDSEMEPMPTANTSGDSDLQKIDSDSEIEPMPIANTSGDSDLQKIDSDSEMEPMPTANTSGDPDLQKIDRDSEIEPMPIANTSRDLGLLVEFQQPEKSGQVDTVDSEPEMEPMPILDTSGDSDLQTESQQPA